MFTLPTFVDKTSFILYQLILSSVACQSLLYWTENSLQLNRVSIPYLENRVIFVTVLLSKLKAVISSYANFCGFLTRIQKHKIRQPCGTQLHFLRYKVSHDAVSTKRTSPSGDKNRFVSDQH